MALYSLIMFTTLGVTQVITMDLHHMQMQGFFDVPVDNVRSSPLLIHYIKENIPDFSRTVVVAKNAGASKRYLCLKIEEQWIALSVRGIDGIIRTYPSDAFYAYY